jgi:hypothetical protein
MTAMTATAPASAAGIEQWDLTPLVSPYLDRHMIFPLLEYLDTLIAQGSISYSTKDVAAARLALLRPTHMVDYAMDVYKTIHGGSSSSGAAVVPPEMVDQKTQVYQQLEDLRRACAPLDQLAKDDEQRVRARVLYLTSVSVGDLCLLADVVIGRLFSVLRRANMSNMFRIPNNSLQ